MLKSAFIYGFDIDENNKYFYFREGVTDYTAELNVGNYTMTTAASELSRALNEVSASGYSVSIDRQNRLFTISCDTAFGILGDSISSSHCNELYGFESTETTQELTHTSINAAGKVYSPAFPLFNYASFEDSLDAGDATVTESSSGVTEIVTTGEVQEMECSIKYITNLSSEGDEYFGDSQAKDKANEFMRYITAKKKVEFCEDINDLDNYTACIVQSTEKNKQGVGYRLKKMKGHEQYFETGRLIFRKLEL